MLKECPLSSIIFAQDCLHVAWRYTYETKYGTFGENKVKVVGQNKLSKIQKCVKLLCIIKWRI